LSRRIIVATAVVALATAGCNAERGPPPAPPAGDLQPRRGGTLRVSVVDDVRALDPAAAFDEFSFLAEHLLFDTLIDYAPATAPDPLALRPALAESWSVSPDGRVYTFTLRPGVTYSDGQPVVASDFVFALTRVLLPATASPGAGLLRAMEGAQDVLDGKATTVTGLRALDDRHLEIRLAEPQPSFLFRLALPFATPQKPSYVAAAGDRIHDTPLGTGPFVLESWRPSESLTFVRNPRYWNPELPYLDRIELTVMAQPRVSALLFARQELDTVDRLAGDDEIAFAANPAWRPYLMRTPAMAVLAEGMNTTRKPFDDVRVRRAMNLAIRKEDVVALSNDRAMVAHGVLPPLLPGYDPTLPAYPHDPAEARRLLAEAGYPDGFEVTYTTIPDETPQLVGQALQADLAEVGVRVRVATLTFPAFIAAAGRGDLDFFFAGWSMDFPDASDFLELPFHSRSITPENAMNMSRYRNPAFDALLDAAGTELDTRVRLALYRGAERMVHDACPWVFHYHYVWVELRQPYVMGYKPHPVWLRNYRETWLAR
jgi:ABC-type transport system substrate-binding protein